MSLLTRSAMIQARVVPWVKQESCNVLQAMGLSMSEAMELFLRFLIEEKKLPFEVMAMRSPVIPTREGTAAVFRPRRQTRRGGRKKDSKIS